MKLKRNCVFFNATTGDSGRTPDWGQELGQGQGYLMKIEGCSQIINGLVYNQVRDHSNFSYGTGGGSYEIEIVSVFNNVSLKVWDAENQIHNTHSLQNPFILIVTKEINGTHIGRRTLKLNKAFSYNINNNEEFYNEINAIISNPWFGYSLSYDNEETGVLTLEIFKAPQPNPIEDMPGIIYETAKERKRIWNNLIESYNLEFVLDNTYAKNKIFYGAPGTGKSYEVNEIVRGNEERTERVTFHPEYDYASFVGGYKPTMDGNDIKYEFVPQAFTNIYVDAWNDIENKYFLVIEEINRGNCAEIFGDIFQLLDRSNDYKVTPSKELHEYLAKELNNYVYNDASKLLLPPNLNILATMNTSDQSLFPMDSAFKRRWDWEYIPINYDKSEHNSSSNFIVQLTDSESFLWLDFIQSVNTLIKSNDNLGMDKCLGNYFIKTESNIIDLETFINKAIFYLWNDVFKDESDDESIFKDRITYEDFFPINPNGLIKVKDILEFLNIKINSSEE